MALTRRQLTRYTLSLGLAAWLPARLRSSQAPPTPPLVTPTSLADTLTRQVTEILNASPKLDLPETQLLVPTYLGNDQRRYYGQGTPEGLNLHHRFYLGSGISIVGGTSYTWSGAGWTGQPTLVRDRGRLYLVIGAYDHQLRKIDLETQEEVWTYRFDDILKGTATIYIDEAASEENRIVILQGSRLGINKSLASAFTPSFRAVSFRTGKELWRMNIRRTDSYSRDNDSSPLYLGNHTLFNAGENSIGYFINSRIDQRRPEQGFFVPDIYKELQLYEAEDVALYRGNLVAESSPARWGDRLYLASGGGRIYGIDIPSQTIVWRFRSGGDLNGTISIAQDGKLFSTLDREHIPGQGGAYKLDPSKPDPDCVDWFLPTGNVRFAEWEGGITGSVALNDQYRAPNTPPLFATNAIDGHLYIGSQTQVTGERVPGPLQQHQYNTPIIIFKERIGASISTPIFTDGNRLISAGYNGVHLFQLNYDIASPDDPQALDGGQGQFYRISVEKIASFNLGGSFEATPVVWDGLVYLCSRDGWMYCLG
ncbi:hypothetical protein E1H12_07200 [Geitlerinema sp. P-1104]|uniref:PQQ-binding-like beta-propeller repeat protein n=1 Tax=Geitlerinema sp. P-1104 TaxID=2546230 RepID=UPI0014774BF8|nr:PQQ-binding-like beta-propeller repeat protein [Geitlerinema sp. P-1104]NMG58316.1 hypothetical protein [Geitlerinema sp. P-1104]